MDTPKAATRGKVKVDTTADALRFLEAMDETCDGPFFRLMAMTGMRRSELGGLTWGAVDLDAGTLEVQAALIRNSVNGKQDWVLSAPKSSSGRRGIPCPVRLLRSCVVA